MQKKAFVLFLLKILRLPLTVVTMRVTATYFGVSFERDVWILVFTAVCFFDAAIWGPINETLRVRFVSIKERHGENFAIAEVRSLVFFVFLISCCVALLLVVFASPVASILAPNYSGSQKDFLVNMIRYTAPYLVINQLTLIGVSILNAYSFFYIPEIAGFVTSVVTILVVVFLAPKIGIYSLLIGYFTTAILMLSVILFNIWSIRIPLFSDRVIMPSFIGFKKYFVFAIPFFFPYFFGQLNSVIEKTLSSSLGVGVVAILDYSRRVPDLMNSIILSLITSMLVPVLTRHFVNDHVENFNLEFRKMFQLGLLVVGAINILMICGGQAVFHLLYGSAAINAQSMDKIAVISILYSLALYGIFLYIIFGMCMLSCNKAKLYATLGIAAQITVILLNLAFKSTVGIYIFPLSIFVAHVASGLVMSFKYPFSDNKITFILLRYILYAFVVGSSLMLLKRIFLNVNSTSTFLSSSSVELVFIGVLQVGLMVLFLFVFRLDEREYISKAYKLFKTKLWHD